MVLVHWSGDAKVVWLSAVMFAEFVEKWWESVSTTRLRVGY